MSERHQNSTRHHGRFVTTRWTQVLASRDDSTEGRQALSDLCAAYYRPVVAFLRTQGENEDDARELAHAFFERVLEKQSLSGADPKRGRFRSYLLGALKHFVANRHSHESRAKRGGSVIHQPLSVENKTDFELPIADTRTESPEKAFDRDWALSVLDRAMACLKLECHEGNRAAEFEMLKPWLTGENAPGRTEAAQKLGLTDGALRVATHRLRRRYRDLVKAEIARTVNDPTEIAAEMQHLIDSLS